MFCQNCGHVLRTEAKFCGECGVEVAKVVIEKPVTFEQFMASRGAEASGLDLQFNAAQKAKQKERSGHFKTKGKKKGDETIKINVGLVEANSELNELKIKRASSLPIPVRKSATDITVKRIATEKHMAHNKSLRVESSELKTEWILLYPDLDAVVYIPGTRDCFSVEKYKESIGKPYNRINLYLCRKRDYEAVLSSDDTDTEQGELEKTLPDHDSSGEVILNIPPESNPAGVDSNISRIDNRGKGPLLPSSATWAGASATDFSAGFDETTAIRTSYRERAPSVVSSGTSAGTSGTCDMHMYAANNYSEYCEIIDVDSEGDDLEMQEAILQSTSTIHTGQERESTQTVLKRFQSEKDNAEDEFQIVRVRRKHLWEDTVRAVMKKSFRCNIRLKVHFIGEEAEDEGGPLREFFRLATSEISIHSGVLQGPDDRKTFSNNPLLIDRGAYYSAGIITGMSLQQGGPGLNCLSPSVYDYFVGGTTSAVPRLQDVADHDTRLKLETISSAMDEDTFNRAVREESDFLIDCGISKMTWVFLEKEELLSLLCKALVLYKKLIMTLASRLRKNSTIHFIRK